MAARGQSAAPQTVDGYAAIVNERVITMGDVLDYIQDDILQLRDTYDGEELDRRREEAYQAGLKLLVEQALIVEEFAKQGGAIPDRLINDRINEVIFEKFDNDRSRFLAALAEEQITLEEWRTRIRERLIVRALRQQEVIDRIRVTPDLLRQAYEQNRTNYFQPALVHLRMITLLKSRTDDPVALREEAIRLRGRALGGEAFAALAEEFSHDNKAHAGGDWGLMNPDDLQPALRDGLKDIPAGGLSDVLETPEAFYLIRVDARQEAHQKTMEEVRPELEREVRQLEGERLNNAWVERLKRKYAVTLF